MRKFLVIRLTCPQTDLGGSNELFVHNLLYLLTR